jgi:hypothetical protein
VGVFKGVESVLADDTKLEIAVWLLGVKVGQRMEPWPDTFAKVFDRVFGKEHLSWKCFLRSSVASCATIGITLLATFAIHNLNWYVAKNILKEAPGWLLVVLLVTNLVPDYISLLKTRLLLRVAQRSRSRSYLMTILVAEFLVTLYIALVAVTYGLSAVLASTSSALAVKMLADPTVILKAFNPAELYLSLWLVNEPGVAALWLFPPFFTSVWLWLYAGSGFVVKAAQRFDISFGWFISKADIEKKPLQSIGLIAGGLVAVVYWTVMIVSRVVGSF